MKLREKNPVLLLVDIQQGFEDIEYWGGNRNNPNAENISGKILETWRSLQLPVIHVRHSSRNPKSRLHASHPGFAFHPAVTPLPDEPVLTKDVNSAFIGTGLEQMLKDQGINVIVVVGLTTNHCISTTVRMAGNLDFETLLVEDATATFDRKGIDGETYDAKLIHNTTLASLNDEFAQIVSSTDLLEQL